MKRCKAICKPLFYKGRMVQPEQRCKRYGRYDGLCNQHHPDGAMRRLAKKIRRAESQLAELKRKRQTLTTGRSRDAEY